jgi:hypothetical protein
MDWETSVGRDETPDARRRRTDENCVTTVTLTGTILTRIWLLQSPVVTGVWSLASRVWRLASGYTS